MNKLLPKTKNNPQGFTLIELMVVIAIIAILSVVGVTVFTSVQKNARDARRRADIDAIAAALEVGKTSTYPALLDSMFSSGKSPVDSANGVTSYIVSSSTTVGAVAPVRPTTWVNTSALPTQPTQPAGTSAYAAVVGSPTGTSNPPASTTAWTVCALLENPTSIYCKSNSQ